MIWKSTKIIQKTESKSPCQSQYKWGYPLLDYEAPRRLMEENNTHLFFLSDPAGHPVWDRSLSFIESTTWTEAYEVSNHIAAVHEIPSGNQTWLLKMAIYDEFSHSTWWFSTAILNYQKACRFRVPSCGDTVRYSIHRPRCLVSLTLDGSMSPGQGEWPFGPFPTESVETSGKSGNQINKTTNAGITMS